MSQTERCAVQPGIGFFSEVFFPGPDIQNLIIGITEPRRNVGSIDPFAQFDLS